MFDWILRLFDGLTRGRLRAAPHIQPIARHNGYQFPNLAEVSAQANAYLRSPWVYVAVNRIAEAAALTPLQVYQLQGEKRIAVERHPLEALLRKPNPLMSQFDLLEQTVGMLELTGNAYWFLAGDGISGVPLEIWTLRPDRVSIVPDEQSFVRGYIYEVDGVRIPLEAVEVIHFKRWHPLNDYYGLSAMQAAALSIQTDGFMAQWNRNTFGQDNGIPAGIVTLPETTPEADFERIKREWRSSYGGTQRRTAFLRGHSITWQSISQSHTDLDYLRGREVNRNEILNVFGIPVGLVSENATEANAKVAERIFIERTLYPKLVRLASKITAELLPFWEQDGVVAFDDIRPTDQQARIADIQASYPVLSINEIRARFYDLPAVAWGDVPVNRQTPPALPEPAPDEANDTENGLEPAEVKAAVVDELRQWEKFTLRRLGETDIRPFAVKHIPDETAFEISALLLTTEDADAVKAVFREARADFIEAEAA